MFRTQNYRLGTLTYGIRARPPNNLSPGRFFLFAGSYGIRIGTDGRRIEKSRKKKKKNFENVPIARCDFLVTGLCYG